MNKKLLLSLLVTASLTASAQVEERERPAEWAGLVKGGKFMDRFQPMKGHEQGGLNNAGKPNGKVWGYAGVQNRYTDNGIEDNVWSYWGGNVRKDEQGIYHQFVACWLEASDRGHMEWGNSYIMHATSQSAEGPFRPDRIIGRGHNPEFYQAKDGTWVIYAIGRRYTSPSLEGPWKESHFDFDTRDRRIIDDLSNFTFAQREDGSYLGVCRGGGIWISEDGISTYGQLTDQRIYPAVEGRFEDPIVWRDNVQYHLIVNDWLGRIAWYLRSADGVNWVTDDGEAYMPGIAKHTDGTEEDWFKYERMKVVQDEFGRPYQANFAVIDTLKHEDNAYDTHSSKNIAIPLNKGVLMNIERMDNNAIVLRIKAEENFRPATDVNVASLRFGANKDVNYGRGAAASNSRSDGQDLIVTFPAKQANITASEFAPKLIGQTKRGDLLVGHCRRPGYDYQPAILSTRRPAIKDNAISLKITNFGMKASAAKALVKVEQEQNGKWVVIGKGALAALKPYESTNLVLPSKNARPKGTLRVTLAGRVEQF